MRTCTRTAFILPVQEQGACGTLLLDVTFGSAMSLRAGVLRASSPPLHDLVTGYFAEA